MERIKALNRYQKGILLLLVVIMLVFTAVYPAVISRVGFAYRDAILIPSEEHGDTIYSGKIRTVEARFTVFADQSVTFQYGDTVYGPYTAIEDKTAIPEENNMKNLMTGAELRKGEEIIFRGGFVTMEDGLWLVHEDGSFEHSAIVIMTDGIETDENGNVIDPMEPSAANILELMKGPKLAHRGNWLGWGCGVFLCILTVVSMLFADELFRLDLALRIHNAEQAEPSEWVIAGRYLSWTLLPVMAVYAFILGLQ